MMAKIRWEIEFQCLWIDKVGEAMTKILNVSEALL
jgi:hypothetical protein